METQTRRRGPVLTMGATLAVIITAATALLISNTAATVTQLTPGQAGTTTFVVDFVTGENGTRGPAGSEHQIGSGTVPADVDGTCTYTIQEENNESENATDLQLRSTVDTVTHTGVETNGFETYTGSIDMTTGSVSVWVILGERPDGRPIDSVSSVNGTVEFVCPITPPPPPSTEPPTTEPPATTVPDTTTTTPGTPTTVPPTTQPPTVPPVATTPTPTTGPPRVSSQPPTCVEGNYQIGTDDNGRPICVAIVESG